MEPEMTVAFPLTNDRSVEQLLKHLMTHRLTFPGNCVVTLKTYVAEVSSPNSFALGTARTSW